MTAYDGRVVNPDGSPAYTARPGFAFAPPPRPPAPASCACADARHHVPGLSCGLPLDGGRYCPACEVLRTIPVYYATDLGPDPADVRRAARVLLDRMTAAGRPVTPKLTELATEETRTVTPDTRTAIADATGLPSDTAPTYAGQTTGPHPSNAAEGIREAIDAARPTEPDREDDRPQADNVDAGKTREPLPVLLDRLATATAYASAAKVVVDELRPEVERRAIERYEEEGTDRFRRDAALVTLRFASDRVVVEDEPALVAMLTEAGVPVDKLYTVELATPGDPRLIADALDQLTYAEPIRMGDDPDDGGSVVVSADAVRALLAGLKAERTFDAVLALNAVEQLGATITKAGTVIADTGEVVEAIRVERGRPVGVQVRCDGELKAGRLADLRSALGA